MKNFTPSEKAATCSICLLTYLRNCGHCAFRQDIKERVSEFSKQYPLGFDVQQCTDGIDFWGDKEISAALLDMMAQGRLYFVDGVYKIRSNYVPEKLEA